MTRNSANRMVWALGCCAALCLTGCSDADPASESTSAPAATGSAAPTESAPPSAVESAPPADDATSGVTAAALCEYLTGQLPQLREIGSEVGVMANVTANLFSWYDEQGALPNGAELDALTQQECSEVGAEVLALAGVESFTAL